MMNRITPALSAAAYKTYQIAAPSDRLVVAACETVGCQAWLYGWETVVDESTDLGRTQAGYIRTQARRTFAERRRGDGLTVFRFESRQRCFAEHRTRPEVYAVKGGDWRGNPTGIPPRIHQRAADWVDDFAEHQEKIKEERA